MRQICETKCREREYLILFSSSKNGRAFKTLPYDYIYVNSTMLFASFSQA